jgi:predicted nucleic acid-binding protein
MTAIFVDTNVLVYARDASHPEKQAQAWAWLESLWRTRTGRIGYQVLHEYYSVVTQRLQPWWDALIVSAARVAGCGYLLTEDLQHEAQLGSVMVIDPFRRRPEDVLG